MRAPLERARDDHDRPISITRGLAYAARMKAGVVPCRHCANAATELHGAVPLCAFHAADATFSRRIARQKAEAAKMRRRP